VVRLIKSRFGQIPLLVFSALPEAMCAEAAIQAGAHGYISKREPGDTLMLAIGKVLAGEVWKRPRRAQNNLSPYPSLAYTFIPCPNLLFRNSSRLAQAAGCREIVLISFAGSNA